MDDPKDIVELLSSICVCCSHMADPKDSVELLSSIVSEGFLQNIPQILDQQMSTFMH